MINFILMEIVYAFVFDCITGILVTDITYIDEVDPGKINLTLVMREIDVFSDNIFSEWIGCEGDMEFFDPRKFCDLIVFSQVCLYAMDFPDDEYEDLKENPEYSFKTTHFRLEYSTNREYLSDCSPIHLNELRWNDNRIYFWNDPLLLNSYHGTTTKYFLQSIEVGEDHFFYGFGYYLNFNIFRMAKTDAIVINEGFVYRETQESAAIEFSLILVDTLLKSICIKPYIGVLCWFYCISNAREDCICPDSLVDNDVAKCEIECKGGYLYRIISYLEVDRRVNLKRCDVRNPCESIPCQYTCLPVTNHSIFCENPKIIIYSLTYNETIFNDIFFMYEDIKVELNYSSLSPEFDLSVYQIGKHLDLSSYVFYLGEILRPSIDISGFTVTGDALDTKYFFRVVIFYPYWSVYSNIKHDFRIYKRLDQPIIYSVSKSTNEFLFLHFGEVFHCNCSGGPKYRILFLWIFKNLNISDNFSPDIKIPINSRRTVVTITCLFVLIVTGRPNQIKNKSITTSLKVITDFNWYPYKDNFKSSGVLNCSVDTYVDYYIQVEQMEGFYDINITGHEIEFVDLHGGFYSLFCLLILIDRYFLSRTIDFYVTTPPTFICLYPYSNIYGSIIQCGHNGYFEDDYPIDVNLYIMNRFYRLVDENFRYVQIPYDIIGVRYKVECSVIIDDNETSLNYTFSRKLTKQTSEIYHLTELNKDCVFFYPYVQIPVMKIVSDYVVEFEHELFYFEHDEEKGFLHILIANGSIIMILLFIIMYVALIMDDEKSIACQTIALKRLRQCIIRYFINDRLQVESKKIIEAKLQDKYDTFFIPLKSIYWTDDIKVESDLEHQDKDDTRVEEKVQPIQYKVAEAKLESIRVHRFKSYKNKIKEKATKTKLNMKIRKMVEDNK